ncbi:oligopeptide transport system substrate-binding protein [Spiroplasma chinense]|uniref:Oligopeptide transport system substrate-binding protein n=1 Tax=Spiroplasma chinense TaxID=216932 RepID=A0A5B9Y725_9MOLU|nr:ABC transporter substrate-binding protein [Spiroplasma chinense]QEH62097.1 oligopeptide transport system substrate-binding protein [Spiroplasma chinense]
MNTLFRKLLSTLSATAAVTLTASSVVACGVGVNSLLNMVNDPKVMRLPYTYNVSSYNTARTMQAEDQKVLANTNDTLLSTDEFGRIYPLLVENTSGVDGQDPTYIGKFNSDKSEWTYKIRKGINWVNSKNEVVGTVKPSDILTAAKFALMPENASDVSSLWTSFIIGAADLYDSLLSNKDENGNAIVPDNPEQGVNYTKPYVEKFINSDKFGIVANDETGEVTFKLTKPAPYFESLLTYSVFSPIYTENADGFADDTADFSKAYFNGAYVVTQSNPNNKVILERNKNYYLEQKRGTVERIEFSYVDNSSASRLRTLFESGSISEFSLSSDDLKGWKKFVGSDFENPNFEGIYATKHPDTAGSFVLNFNLANWNAVYGQGEKQKQAQAASRLLQSDDVRSFISTTLNRSKFVRYFSKTIDTNETSQMLRNSWTGVGVASTTVEGVKKDYTEFVSDRYDEIAGTTAPTGSHTISDGTDVYLNKEESLVGKTKAQLISDIKEYIKANNITTTSTKVTLNNGKKVTENRVVLRLIASPTGNASVNPYTNLMLKEFNGLEGNPIFIQTDVPSSTDDYRQQGAQGAMDLYIGGWSPDYSDPATFLETFTLGGSYSSYNGTARLIRTSLKSGEKVGTAINDFTEYKSEGETIYFQNAYYVKGETEKAYEMYKKFSDEYQKIDRTETESVSRFTAFSKIESDLLYKNFMMLPLYTRAMPKQYVVSFVQPWTRTYEAFGTGNYRYYDVVLNQRLLNRESVQAVMKAYEENLAEVSADPTSHRDQDHWK